MQDIFHHVGLTHFVTLSAIVFMIGICGIVLNRKNIIIILMSIELMLLSININMVAFSSFMGDLGGQIFTFFVLTIAAAELAIGLAIVTVFYRNRGNIDVDAADMMKG